MIIRLVHIPVNVYATYMSYSSNVIADKFNTILNTCSGAEHCATRLIVYESGRNGDLRYIICICSVAAEDRYVDSWIGRRDAGVGDPLSPVGSSITPAWCTAVSDVIGRRLAAVAAPEK